MFSIEDVFRRLRKAYDVETNKELALKIGVNPSTLSNWSARGVIPQDVLFKIALEKSLSLDWLIWGKEEQSPALSDLEALLLNSFKQLDDGAKLRILSAVANGGEPAGVSQTNENGANNYFRGDNVSFNEK